MRRAGSVVRGRGARSAVIDEHDAMPDEDIVFESDTLAEKTVARDFAAPADADAFLDFDAGTDAAFIADGASVQIDELRKPDAGA